MVACQLKNSIYASDIADIIVSDHINNSKKIVDNIANVSNIFRKVIYAETKSFYEYSHIHSLAILLFTYSSFVKSSYHIGNDYDIFAFANIRIPNNIVYKYLKKGNRNVYPVMFEDGIASYSKAYGDYLKKCQSHIIQKHICKLYQNIKEFWVFNDKYFMWDVQCAIRKIPKINKKDTEFLNILNAIFKYDNIQDKYDKKVIFFEESFSADGADINDTKVVSKLCEEFGKENIFIKVHPRNTENRFEKQGYITNKNTAIPWEVVAMNLDFKDKILVSISSASIINMYLLFNEDIKSKMYFKCFDKSKFPIPEVIDVIEKICNENKEHIELITHDKDIS